MGGARGEGSDRVLFGCFRTNAANCEFPKVSRPLALSTAELHEAPFQGSRRRHLPAAAAKPDGTRARPGGYRHFRGGRSCRQVRKPAEKGGYNSPLRGFQSVGWRTRVDREEARGESGRGSRLCLREPSPCRLGHPRPGGGAVPFSRRPRGRGRGRVCFHFENPGAGGRRRAAGLSFPGGARSGESGQLSALCRVPSSRSAFPALGWQPVNRLVSFSAFSDTWDGERASTGERFFCVGIFSRDYSCILGF